VDDGPHTLAARATARAMARGDDEVRRAMRARGRRRCHDASRRSSTMRTDKSARRALGDAVALVAMVTLANAVEARADGACFPSPMRQDPWLMFGGRRGAASSRVDVNTLDGDVRYRGKSADDESDAHSVSGVHYAPFGRTALDLNAPSWSAWPSAGEYWSTPELYCDSRGLVTLTGLLKGPQSRGSRFGAPVATLPERCRPQGRLIFPVRSDYGDARIDVKPSGELRWIAGPDSSNNEVTLSGVTFTSASVEKTDIELKNDWRQPPKEYENARYVCKDGLVIVSGFVERFSKTKITDPTIAQLPAGCRPTNGALMFSVMSKGEKSESVVIDTDGNIKWKGTSKGIMDSSSFWVSLSGIVFANGKKSMYSPNERGTPSFKVPKSFYANPSYTCDAWRGALVVLEGMVFAKSPHSGARMMKLPIDATNPRPRPSVKISNPITVVSSSSVDFGVRVEHATCRNNCEMDAFPTTGNDLEKIRCEVRVQKRGENCLKFGSHMPCRNWDNFYPSTLSMTDEIGVLIPGVYDVLYSCYGAYEQRTKMIKLQSFRVEAGCDSHLPTGGSGGNVFDNVARHLLLSSPDLHGVDCNDKTSVYRAKEAVFRLYDNDPADGVLSYKEILAALEMQSADSHIITFWNEKSGGKLDLKPSHVMNARIDDMTCGAGPIVYDSAVYPSDNPGRETDETECERTAASMRVAWHYNTTLSAGDFTCLYIDGVLYDKLAVTFDKPNFGTYSKVQNLYAPTEITDIRPISGTFEDVQQSLVANFLFDKGDTSSLITSASPLVAGQTGSKPTLIPIDMTRTLSACTGGDGGGCLKEVSSPTKGEYGFKYEGTLPTLDVAITSWVYSSCPAGTSHISRKTIALFNGPSDSLRFYLDRQSSSVMDLKVVFSTNNRPVSLTIAGVKCRKWHQVGFSLNRRDGLVLFVNAEGSVRDTAPSDTYKKTQLAGVGEILSRMNTLQLLGAVGVEFDDVRIYTGQVSKATFLDAYQCGRRILCARRAHTTPSSRRVLCASVATQTEGLKLQSDFSCTSAMYYDGSAIDVAASLGMSGVTFSFRDTAVGESSFEMLRRPYGATVAAAKYETVIQMDGDLKSCGNKFSSITFLDREAGSKPNLEWYYKVRTKMPRSSGLTGYVSTTHYFKAPWIATLAGKVHAGRSQTPVPHVRVCADFVRSELATSAQEDTINNLALYMKTEHSGNVTRTADESTFLITDGDTSVSSGASLVKQNEYLRVELSRWSAVNSVVVCADSVSSALKSAKVYVHDECGVSASEFGKECVMSASGVEINGACVSFTCNTNDIESFHGKYVTVVNTKEYGMSVTEIIARGFETKCAFTSVTNNFGSYSMELRDTSGRMPEEATLVTAAYREDLILDTFNGDARRMVVHVFDKNEVKPSLNAKEVFTLNPTKDLPKGNIIQIMHQNQMKHDFVDETTVIVRGAILFPSIRAAGSTTCGLFEAVIQVKEVDGTDDVIEVKTDELGRFEIALTRGNSFQFNATFPKHTICYAGNELQDAASTNSCDGLSQTATISHVDDGHTIYFTDVTQGNIDLGVYQGQCEALYSGAKFKIMPVNRCHEPIYVTSEDVRSWMTKLGDLPEDKFPEKKSVPENTRAWPFAAMDYSIILESGPSVAGIQDMIKEESWNEGCATEDGDMVTFFKRRNALERLAAMRNSSDWVQIRYNYHGFICVDIPDQYIPKVEDKDELCYDPKTAATSRGLTSKHFLGQSSALNVQKTKFIRMKVFELHASNGKYEKCFAALPDKAKGTGSTKVKIRQDVSDAEDSECHPARGGGESCDFQVLLDDEAYLTFPGGATEFAIDAGQPNLAGNHRRTVRIEVERNDLYRSIVARTVRELIPLGSKPRGREGLSDDTFWATVPFDGLVYTVVHDPPGGNSYAELSSGSEVKIEWVLASTRAMTVKTGSYAGSGFGFMTDGKYGMNLGYTAEASSDVAEHEVKIGVNGEADVDGPNFSVESESSAGWDLTMTTDRVISSSQDPALPGRSGDVILGGGIELVYKISDILDLRQKEKGKGKFCLDVFSAITWLPRKPTTYVLMVHSIESQILPNLKFLLATAVDSSIVDMSGKVSEIDWADYIKRKISSWERTLRWATPENTTSIQASLTGSDSVFGKNLEAKMNNNAGWGYNELFTQDDDFRDVAMDLANEWASSIGIDLQQLTPMYLLASATTSPTTPPLLMTQTAALGPLAYVQAERLLPHMRNDSDAHPASSSSNPGHLPYTTRSIIHPIVRSDKIKPNYDETLKDVSGETFYSYGMNDFAAKDMDNSSEGFRGTADGIGEEGSDFTTKPEDSTQVISSMTGGSARTAISKDEKTKVMLTFSGGGSTIEFSFNSHEANADYKSHITFKFDGGEDFSGGFHREGELSSPFGGLYYDDDVGLKYGWAREVAHDRTFFWNKYGFLTTKYSLGDPEYGDKFVVSVGSDKRFGTPVFAIKGGRSMCPGELGTVFRESGVTLEIPLNRKTNAENLNPGEQAIFEVVIKNESPYREPGKFALRLVDGLSASLRDIVSAAYARAAAEPTDAYSVFEEVSNVASSIVAKDSEDVLRVKSAAETAKGLNGATPRSVADAVYSAASTAPHASFELRGTVFSVNGNGLSVGDYVPFKFVGGDALDRQKFVSQEHLSLVVTPGRSTRSIQYLQLQLTSLCESEMDLSRDPIAHTINVDPMSWSQPCPKVQFDESTASKYMFSSQSPSSSGELNLRVNNPDRYLLWPGETSSDSELMNARLKFVRVQYRPVSGGEWITAKDEGSAKMDNFKFNLLCDNSRTEGCKFDWKINNQYEKLLGGFKDNVYELRVKNFCFGGPSMADSSVHEYVSDQRLTLTVDTKAPMVKKYFTFGEKYFGVELDEAIDCSNHETTVWRKYTMCDNKGSPVKAAVPLQEFDFKCTQTESGINFMVGFPQKQFGTFSVTVSGVRDVAGNTLERFTFNANAWCSLARDNFSWTKFALGNAVTMRERDMLHENVWTFTPRGVVKASIVVLAVAFGVMALRRRRDARTNLGASADDPARARRASEIPAYGSTL